MSMNKLCITLIGFLPMICCAEYLGVSSLNLKQQHNYIGSDITIEQLAYGAEFNLQNLRIKRTGWFARGPRAMAITSQNSLYLDGHVNLYQNHLHQGIWLQIEYSDSEYTSQINQSFIYLDHSGVASAISSGDTILSNRTSTTSHIYWYESVKDEGPINTASLFYNRETAPAASTLSTTNAQVFDGQFSGFGFTLGRIKDDKGLNFQWRLTMAQLDSDFSNQVTNHRNLSTLESTSFKLAIQLDWHYRYYLAPYWYLVPSAHLQYSSIIQRQLNPEIIEHEALNYLQYSARLSLRKYF